MRDLLYEPNRIHPSILKAAYATILLTAAASWGAEIPASAKPAVPSNPGPAASLAVAGQLIPQLGDQQFSVREAATVKLNQMGIEIEPALVAALESTDAEIRYRARKILAYVTENDLQKRLVAFAEDVDDTKHLDLPGWSRFRKSVATDRAGRKLFVEMQRAEMSLLKASEGDPQPAARLLESRIRIAQNGLYQNRIVTNNNGPTLGCIAGLMFVASDKRISVSDETAMMLANLQYMPAFQQGLAAGGQAEMLRRLFGEWVVRDASPAVLWQNLGMALRFNMKEALEPSLKALRQPAQLPAHVRHIAIVAVAKFGGKEHLPVLAPFLKDVELCGNYSVKGTQYMTQVRDVALVFSLRLAGEDPKKYGFNRLENNEQLIYQLHTIGFGTAAERDAGFKKWEQWQAEHQPASAAQPAAKS